MLKRRVVQLSLPLLGLFIFAGVAQAQQTTYYFVSVPFTTFSPGTNCPPTCRITGSFTVSQPLPPNINLPVNIIDSSGTFTPTSFTFTDGVRTITNTTATISGFAVNTDANGNIVQWNFYAQNSTFYVFGFYFPDTDSQAGFANNSGGAYFDARGVPTGTWCKGTAVCSYSIQVSGANGVAGPPFLVPPSNQSGSIYSNDYVSQLGILIKCIDNETHLPAGDCRLRVSFVPVANSGGHIHSNPIAPAFLASPSITDTVTGLNVLYTAPENSGDVKGTASGTDPQGNTITPVPFIVHVELGPLAALSETPFDQLTGDTTIHPDNHFGITAFNNALTKSAAAYYQILKPGELVLGINDMCLQYGGIFDFDADWDSPHNTHRVGHSADIGSGQGVGFKGSIPVGHRIELKWILYHNSLVPIREDQGNGIICNPVDYPLLECTHWHVEPK
jgi:hypothetical protein